MLIDLSAIYPSIRSIHAPYGKGQLALFLAVGGAAAVMVVPLNPESAGLRWLKHCSVAGINDNRRSKVVSHGGYVTFQLTEVAVSRQMFRKF